MSGAFLDLEGALRDWGNSQADLVGPGKPLALGFPASRLRSPARGCYAVLESGDGGDGTTAEGVIGWSRLTATIYSATDKEAAAAAALAYAGALSRIAATRPVLVTRGVRLLMAADVRWPVLIDVEDEPAYAVTADVHGCAS